MSLCSCWLLPAAAPAGCSWLPARVSCSWLLLAALHFLVTLGCFWLSWIFRFFWSAWLRVPFRTCLSAWPLAWFCICWSICCGFLKLFAQQNHLFVFPLRSRCFPMRLGWTNANLCICSPVLVVPSVCLQLASSLQIATSRC